MPLITPYENQYLALPKDDKIRTTFEGGRKDIGLLRSYDTKEGTLQTTLSILLIKLTHELRNSGIQQGDWSAYQFAITNANIVLGGSPNTVQRSTAIVPPAGPVDTSAGKTACGNVRRRTAKVAQPVKGHEKSHDTSSAS